MPIFFIIIEMKSHYPISIDGVSTIGIWHIRTSPYLSTSAVLPENVRIQLFLLIQTAQYASKRRQLGANYVCIA